ncbi:MAG: hypothetical protein ACOCT9_01305 [archaeon]
MTVYLDLSKLPDEEKFKDLKKHIGHRIEIVCYENDETIYNISIECVDCNKVIEDYEIE